MDILYDTSLRPYFQFTKIQLLKGDIIGLILQLRVKVSSGVRPLYLASKTVCFYFDRTYFTTVLQSSQRRIN